jgi:hypothetical protein
MSELNQNSELRRVRLGDLVDIRPGYPFRGRIETSATGDGYVVHPRNVSSEQLMFSNSGKQPMEMAVFQGRKAPDFLQHGDVLFLAKGHRNFAVCVDDVPSNTVITPFFFLLRVNEPQAASVLPAFLAWQMNHGAAEMYFARGGQGTAVRSIIRAQLENLPILLPTVEKQQFMVELVIAAQQEKNIMSKLIENRQQQLKAIGRQLLS